MEPIKTKLKFVKSDENDKWIGFVSINTKDGRVRGVHRDADMPKMICIVPNEIAETIEPNVLYDVQMVNMKRSRGYIVESADPVMFRATIETSIIKNFLYLVEVKFGNKVIYYDPLNSKSPTVNSIPGVLTVLRSRKDIKDYNDVEEEFLKVANIVQAHFEQDGHYVSKKTKVAKKA